MGPRLDQRPDAAAETEPTIVVLHDAAQLHYWTQRFGATEERLRLALREVGRDSAMVQLYLSRKSWP